MKHNVVDKIGSSPIASRSSFRIAYSIQYTHMSTDVANYVALDVKPMYIGHKIGMNIDEYYKNISVD